MKDAKIDSSGSSGPEPYSLHLALYFIIYEMQVRSSALAGSYLSSKRKEGREK